MKLKYLLMKYNYLIRIFITILLALCIPFTAMSFFVTQNSYKEMRESNNASYLKNVSDFAGFFNDQTDSLATHAFMIGLDGKLSRKTIESHPWQIVEAIQMLSSYKNGVDFVQTLGIHFIGTDYIITSSSKLSLQDYASRYSNASAALEEQIIRFILSTHSNTGDYFSLYNASPSDDATLFFAVPIFLGSSSQRDAVMLYAMNKASLYSIFPDSFMLGRYAQCVFDAQDSLLYTNRDIAPFLENEGFLGFLADKEARVHMLQTDGYYYLYKIYDPLRSMSFLSVIKREMVEENLLSFYRTLRTAFILSTSFEL